MNLLKKAYIAFYGEVHRPSVVHLEFVRVAFLEDLNGERYIGAEFKKRPDTFGGILNRKPSLVWEDKERCEELLQWAQERSFYSFTSRFTKKQVEHALEKIAETENIHS